MWAGLSVVAPAATLSGLVWAQEPGFEIPSGWVASADNDRAPGEPGFRICHEQTGLELVYVPSGTFLMGSDDGPLDERPAHEVSITGFWIGRTEVTVAQWRMVTGTVPAPDINNLGDEHPVILVGWDQCRAFCDALGLRLPTEAEWEYAAAGPQAHLYPWGNLWDDGRLQWNPDNDPDRRTVPVGSFPEGASWCGALDMAGNVWEWCTDYYDPGYYAESPPTDPPGPATEVPACVGMPDGTKHTWNGLRTVRGGCFTNRGPEYFRCSMRNNDPSAAHYALGLRVALGGAATERAGGRSAPLTPASSTSGWDRLTQPVLPRYFGAPSLTTSHGRRPDRPRPREVLRLVNAS